METTQLGKAVPQLPVDDVEKTQTYYKEKLGFEILWIYADKYWGCSKR